MPVYRGALRLVAVGSCCLVINACVSVSAVPPTPSKDVSAPPVFSEAFFYAAQSDAVVLGQVSTLSNFAPAEDGMSTQMNMIVREVFSGRATIGHTICLRTSFGLVTDGRTIDESGGIFRVGSPRSPQVGNLALVFVQRRHYEARSRRLGGNPLPNCLSPFVGVARVDGQAIQADLPFALPRSVKELRQLLKKE